MSTTKIIEKKYKCPKCSSKMRTEVLGVNDEIMGFWCPRCRERRNIPTDIVFELIAEYFHLEEVVDGGGK